MSERNLMIDNIKYMRHLLNEGVGDNTIIDAINNHEWVYLYYLGDDDMSKGYRTIRPYVLGIHSKSGNKVLRAWQDNPKNSFHFNNRPTRKDSKNHDYWTDGEGDKPGWRMFRVDKISKILPIGKKFHDSNGLVMIPSGYHEGGDDDMSSIIAYVSTKKEPDFTYKYDKDFYGDLDTTKDSRVKKWDSIRRGNKNSRNLNTDDVIKLKDLATKFYKKKMGNYIVVIDDLKNYHLVTSNDISKFNIPDSAIIGDLPYLYDKYIGSKSGVDDRNYKNKLDKVKSSITNQTPQSMDENNELHTIPFKIKTFFK